MLAQARPTMLYIYTSLVNNYGKSEKKKKGKEKKNRSHLAGLEPATFRLTAERANRLRHKCLLVLVLSSLLYVIMDDVDHG